MFSPYFLHWGVYPVSALMSLSINLQWNPSRLSPYPLSPEGESPEPAQGVCSDSHLPDHVRRRGCCIKVKLATSWMKYYPNLKWVWHFQRVFEEHLPLTQNIFLWVTFRRFYKVGYLLASLHCSSERKRHDKNISCTQCKIIQEGFDSKAEESNLSTFLFQSLPKVIHLKNKLKHSHKCFSILDLLFCR